MGQRWIHKEQKMKVTNICKANSFRKIGGIEGQAICIDNKIPEEMTLEASKLFHARQAHLINEALSETLPQGTYDRLGIMFMQKKLSLYQGRTE